MTQILRGLSGGLSNIARGVATASEDWPRASAERARLEQQKEQFDLEQARYQARLELDERKALETAKHHKETMAEGLRKDQLKILSDQVTSLGKLLPEAIGDDDAVRNIQERMEALRQEALSIAQEQEPSGVAGYPSQYGGNLGAIQDGAPVSRISRGLGEGPPPITEGEDLDLAEPPPLDLSSLGKGKRAELFNDAVDEGIQFYEDSEDIELSMRKALLHYPNASEEEIVGIRQMIEGSEPPAMAQDEIEALAYVAHDYPSNVILNNLTRSQKAAVAKAMIDLGLIITQDIPVTVIRQLSDFDVALHELADLHGLVEDNPDMFGPIAGRWFRTLLWTPVRETAKKIEGRYADVRQTVGKAKEGGVLRKEDEAKYLKIIGSTEDEPKVAMFKIRHLLKSLKFQRDRYLSYVKQAGMYVDIEKLDPLLPVNPKTAEFDALLFYREEWPELDKAIAERFPEEYKKYILPELKVEDKEGVSINPESTKLGSLTNGVSMPLNNNRK